MNKENILTAVNAMLNGENEGFYHDELSAILSIVMDASDADIEKAVAEIHEDE